MTSDPSHPQTFQTDEAWHELDELLEQIAQLAASEASPAQFYAALLNHVMRVLAAEGGAIWVESPDCGLGLAYQANFPGRQLADSKGGEQRHLRLLQAVLGNGSAQAVPPRSGSSQGDEAGNPTDYVLLICPWRQGDLHAGVVELFHPSGLSGSAQRGYLRFLAAVCELVADFHQNRLLSDFRYRMERFGRFGQFVERVHSSLDLQKTAYQIANEGRPLVGCDRLSVAVMRGSACRLAAVSGVDTVNRRANVVRLLEQLCRAVAVGGEAMWHPNHTQQAPPEIETPLNEYLDVAHVKSLAIVPLRKPCEQEDAKPGDVMGLLVVEQFHAAFDEHIEQMVSMITGHCESAIGNALELKSVPLVRLWQTVGKARWFVQAKQLPKTVLALFVVAALVTALFVVPADFEIEAPGELQPQMRRELFAPYDAVVQNVAVEHGSQIESGQLLVELRKPELDFELERVLGELQTARKRLASVEAERLQDTRQTDEQRRRYAQLTAEEEEVREVIRSLEKQLELLESQRSELRVNSPIDGQVLTWDLHQLLESRPVARGQVLMTVADRKGPWRLELRIPDDRVAHVLEAEREMDSELDVSFVLATAPGDIHHGKLKRVGLRAEPSESEGPFVLATVDIDSQETLERVPGANVAARICCGRRSVGYVWLRELIEAIQRWILF